MNNYTTILKYLFILAFPLFIISCDSNEDDIAIEIIVPTNYDFLRDGVSTVSFSGQTTRLKQVDEIYSALNSNTYTEAQLDEMFADGAGFTDSTLNGTGKNVRGKTSAGCAAGNSATQAQFDAQIADFANNVVPAWANDAAAGVAGKLTDTKRSIHVNAKGHEIDQTFVKGLIGGMGVDQIVNNYLQPCQLDSGTRKDDNTNGVVASGKIYTDMEHKWDEAFGYLYGQEEDAKRADLGSAPTGNGTLLNKYFKKVNGSNQPGIAEIVFNAFKKGRAAIVAGDYQVRDAQANIIQIHLSKVIGYKAVDYLNDYMSKKAAGNTADAFHALSEGYGFVMSLQFTNNGSNVPYFTKAEADAMLAKMDDFWTVQDADLTSMVSDIKSKFGI
tara:strand:+ start:189 stop:1346 length:1158 start_codon:yes stop_codon:yes gene_type:complete